MAMLKFFKFPFATSGDKTAIPDASQPSGSVSYTDGFGVDYELDPGVDPAAKDVPRDESNQLYFDITNAIKEYQEFGTPDFITTALNGGVAFSYSKYARVKWTDGKVYESRKNANTSDPTVAADWRVVTDNVDYLAIATTAFQASVIDGEAVYWDGAQFDEAVADGTTKQNMIGFADVTNGRVFVAGLYAGQLAGLTANLAYYLSPVTPGALTSAIPTTNIVRVGVAKSATDMYVEVTPQTPDTDAAVSGGAKKLKGSATGTNAVVTYTADQVVVENTTNSTFRTLRNINGTITMTSAGANGLDTGAVAASTWYYAFAIYNPTTATIALLASLSSTAPTMPSGYTEAGLIGAFRTDGTANKYPLSFIQYGRRFSYKPAAGSNLTAIPVMATGVAGTVGTTGVAVAVGNFVPTTIAANIKVAAFCASGTAVQISSSTVMSLPGSQGFDNTAGSGHTPYLAGDIPLESTNIYWASSSASNGIHCLGWEGYF